jgi:DNA (cytosine-5)-methyltransferase 1
MDVGSLFSGIGGIELGMAPLGFHPAWFVERDPFCQAVLAERFPSVPIYGDIRGIDPDDLMPVDVLTGGFPCQDISIAGWGGGIQSHTRSGLWFEYHRFIEALRPRYVIIENVPEIRRGRLHTVLADLASIRYDAEWYSIPASFVGAPHKRERVFILAYPNSEWLEEEDPRPRLLTQEEGGKVTWNIGGGAVLGRSHWPDQPQVSGVDDGIPEWLDENIRALGNACVPQVVRFLATQILEYEYGW